MKPAHALPAFALLVTFAASDVAEAQSSRDHRTTITPYIWLPNIEGNMAFQIPNGSRPNVRVGPNDYLENLDMAAMIAGDYRGRNWSIFGDIIYLDFSNENSSVRTVSGPGGLIQVPIDVGSQIGMSGLLATAGAGFELIDKDSFTFDLFVGTRYLDGEAQLNWSLQGPLNLFPQSGSIDAEQDVWDGLVGFRGEGRFGAWFFPYYFDIGGGDSNLTLQGIVGAGYRFGGWDIRALYRHLYYEQGSDGFLNDIAFSGPALGATFRF
jgi:hypothetical protein